MVFFGICLLLGIAFVLYAFALMNSNKKITLKYFILMLIGILLLIFAVILLINNKKSDTPEPSPTTIVEKTEEPKATEIWSETPYVTETPTHTLIPTPTLTPSPTSTVEPTQTETPTPTLAPTPTPTPTPTEDPNTFKTVKYDPNTIVKPENWNNSIIYLTFDDGPSYSITPKLLDILKKYNVKATFFVVGKYLDSNLYNTLKRALEEGHQVGIHTYCHDYDVIYKSVDAYLDDFNKIDNLLKTKLNYEATVFRFPGGTSNTVSRSYCKGVMTQLVSIMKEKGYVETDWNVSPEDATNNLTTQQVFDGILKELNVNNKENIVLMHDYSGLDTTAEAVDKFIPWALQQGYAFDRVTVGHGILQHKVQN